jgi:hypothetical protein
MYVDAYKVAKDGLGGTVKTEAGNKRTCFGGDDLGTQTLTLRLTK